MNIGFVKVGAVTPDIKVADVRYNGEQIRQCIDSAVTEQVKLLVFPELCLTGYTCGDLFLQNTLLEAARDELSKLADFTEGKDLTAIIGLPLTVYGKLYNTAAVIHQGKILGIVPKKHLPNYSEFYEIRHFTPAGDQNTYITINGQQVPFGMNLIFTCSNLENYSFAVEICEDLWVPTPPSNRHAMAGATLIANLSASDETTGKDEYRRKLVLGQSARLISGYIYADAGEGESTTDMVFGGSNMIAENGAMLSGSRRFTNEMICAELDLYKLAGDRKRMNTYESHRIEDYSYISFSLADTDLELTRVIDPMPFVPADARIKDSRCEEILMIQAMGMKKRMEHTWSKHAVIGISGGLDSTLALLVAVKAFDLLNLDRKNIIAVTMPCFGTTDRTYQNACTLVHKLGATLIEIDIKEAVLQHFKDIGHSADARDITYENSQARERTQVLMDLANRYNGMVIGTGDMSELALGWATYNGDHMSMYGVNASVPKTLVRHLVRFYADMQNDNELKAVLYDILDTPVSPELLPPEEGEIAQKTEDLVGPYELHDFYLYHLIRYASSPKRIYTLACHAFVGQYDKAVILKWLKVFFKRFFTQQFKRSCLPDGPKVGSVALSPRGDWRMPSDASARLWMEELENIEI